MIDERGYGDLLDLVYEAAVAPRRWTAVMERIADLVRGGPSILSRLSMVNGRGAFAAASRVDPSVTETYFEHYALNNPLSNVDNPEAYVRAWSPRLLTDEDWIPKPDLLKTEFYNDFLKPQGVHSALMIRLALDGYDLVVMNISRSPRLEQFASPELELVGSLHPHLIRAFKLGRAFADDKALGDDLGEVVDRAADGVFVLDRAGRVRRMNPAGEAQVARGDAVTIASGRLRLAAPRAQERLDALIEAAVSAEPMRRRGGSIAVSSPRRQAPLALSVTPLGSERFRPLGGGAGALVRLTDLETKIAPPGGALRDLFGLSPAEIRVAGALFAGCSPRQAAAALGISFFTVRGHLARIREKTQTTGQVDLARLMMRLVGAGP